MKAKFHVRKCLLIKKAAVCHCFQEVICLVRKVSGLHSATNRSWNLGSSLILFEQDIFHLLREANNASRPCLSMPEDNMPARRCLSLSGP